MTDPIRIANCSGFYGDRMAAAREMIEGGPIDVLTGDWLAELTMLILAKNRMKDANTGFAKTFVKQMEDVMGLCLERGIKVVSNAGGLAPAACAEAIRNIAAAQGLSPTIAVIEGDDIAPRLDELRAAGIAFDNLDTGESIGSRQMLTANAYLGCWGIVDALDRGADIVITGRVTDAAVVIGPAAWHHGWARNDYDALAGALTAGHVIECGTQATGGNYAFFQEVPDLTRPGFPIAEIAADGSSVITKHEGHGGLVSIGTVTAQLLYEIGPPAYLNPDVTARFDTIQLEQQGDNRVRISGTRGEPPPDTLKVCMNYLGGHRTTMTQILTGLDIEDKARVFEQALWAQFPEGRAFFDDAHIQLIRTDHTDPDCNETAMALLRVTVKDADPNKVGRRLFSAITELALANYPGFTAMGMDSQAYGVYWPTLIPAEMVAHTATIDDDRNNIEHSAPPPANSTPIQSLNCDATAPGGATRATPLGRLFGARSGDKGGNANVGVWARSAGAYAWLEQFLTEDKLRQLMPETAELKISRHPLPGILSINFVIHGLLGEGVASSVRIDPQAKGLGEYLRAKVVDIPVTLLEESPS